MPCPYMSDDDRSLNSEETFMENLAGHDMGRISKTLLDSSFDAIVVCSMDGSIVHLNASTLEMFGYSENVELIGSNVSKLAGGGIGNRHEAYMKMFARRGATSSILGKQRDVMALRKDGSEFFCKVGVKKVPGTNLLVGYIRDISAEKEAEQLAMEMKEAETRAAEQLLMNMLPAQIAQRLKLDPSHIADYFTRATVLFADIVGFTSLSNQLKPIEVVRFLNDIFSRFDERLETYGLNKVKTIGDCYMVTNVPVIQTQDDSTSDFVCHFALDMIEALEEYNRESNIPLQMRIGINTGSLVAGVVGTKRFLYDVWGDSVNIASRMESTGIPGRVQVTENVVNDCDRQQLLFERRGCVQVKGIGIMETFFLKGRTARKRKMDICVGGICQLPTTATVII
mmetsp:Transcript_2816/g.5876  ORF Transcript_2816/g.5876 Transcript_2816/m.5876 type:complete len:397 (-) Transcript_2816:828-2018(-)